MYVRRPARHGRGTCWLHALARTSFCRALETHAAAGSDGKLHAHSPHLRRRDWPPDPSDSRVPRVLMLRGLQANVKGLQKVSRPTASRAHARARRRARTNACLHASILCAFTHAQTRAHHWSPTLKLRIEMRVRTSSVSVWSLPSSRSSQTSDPWHAMSRSLQQPLPHISAYAHIGAYAACA